jgi:triosephosphate isomerase
LRRPVIAGNWKMYKTQAETRTFFQAFLPMVAASRHCDIIVAPPFTALGVAVEATRGTAVGIAGQNTTGSAKGLLRAKFPLPCSWRPAARP